MNKNNKIIKRRAIPNGEKLCEHPLLDRIYRARAINNSKELERNMQNLINPAQLHNINNAVDLLLQAREDNLQIVIVGDFDADGATSTALSMIALQQLGFHKVKYLIPNRFEQGYGLSVDVAQMALDAGAELVMTVDNGVSSFAGVDFLKQHNVLVLVTDHHLPAENLPNADVIVNPNLNQCDFPSKALAGVGVAFYVMLALRAKLRSLGEFEHKPQPNFSNLLDLVALGTIADVVPLDQNNRTLAFQGLQRMQKGVCRPGIKALVEVAKRNLEQLCAADLGFAIAPRLNAAGRLDNMSTGVELLLSDNMSTARALALEIDGLNQTRKEIEEGMKLEALKICENLKGLENNLPTGIALYQADWHQGVLGIIASRIKDKFYRPTIAFAQDQEGIIKGSARSIPGLHMRDVLERIHSKNEGMILTFGGHAMAAGLTIREECFSDFQKAFNQVVKDWLEEEQLQGIIWSDGELEDQFFNLATAEQINQAGPWGQAFPEPIFDGEFKIMHQRLLQDKHIKFILEPKNGGAIIDAIAFNVDRNLYPDLSLKSIKLAYKLNINEFKGNRTLQLMIEHMEPLE